MMEQFLGMIGNGTSLVLLIVLLVGIFIWRAFKEPLITAITSHTSAKQREMLAQLGREAFAYAESVHAGQDGPAKRNEAVKFLLDRCEGCGLRDVDMKDVRAVIESAWLQDRRQSGQPVVPHAVNSQAEQR
jgi:Bacteriophage holin of superfamily 6 (Holin_LLH)